MKNALLKILVTVCVFVRILQKSQIYEYLTRLVNYFNWCCYRMLLKYCTFC